MNRCCKNCSLYMNPIPNSDKGWGVVYRCNPTLTKNVKREQLTVYSCNSWKELYPKEVEDILGTLFGGGVK